MPLVLTQRRVKPFSQHIFAQSPPSNQHLFLLSQHRHSSQPVLQERPPSSPSSVVRAQTGFTLTSSSLYDIYTPFGASFLQTITEDILIPLAEAEDDSTFYTYGLDVVSWLSGTVLHPAVSYLASVPVSFPLIGLTQLVQYLVVCRVANLTPGELRNRISGATGHSRFRCHCRLRNFRRVCRQLPQSLEMALLFRPERSTSISCHLH